MRRFAQHRTGELGKETLDEVQPRAVLGREGELEAASWLIGKPSSGPPGDGRSLIIEDQTDRSVWRVNPVEKLEELDELTAAVAILDQVVNVADQEIDAGQQGDRAVPLVLMLACTFGTGGKPGAVVAMA
jgi:hypothetical protein